jgi:hypothetical protein
MRIHLSKSGVIIGFFFLVLLLLYLAILPYGDEPDFTVQVPYYILFLDSVNLSYYSDGISSISNCKYLHNPFHFFGMYDLDSCIMNIELAVKRALFTYLIYMPLLVLSIFNFKRSSNTRKTIFKDYSFSNKSIQLVLIFPSFIYYASLFSKEQVTLMLSVIILFTALRARYLISVILLMILVNIDKGNAVVLTLVISSIFVSIFIYRTFGYRVFLIVSILSLALAYFFSTDLLNPLRPLSTKIDDVLSGIEANYIGDKYPLLLRPFLTFMSFNFMPPALSKHPLLYLLTASGLAYTVIKSKYNKKTLSVDKEYLVVLLAVITTILFIIFILPGYNNAKYYIFTLPIFFNTILKYISFSKLVIFIVICHLVVLMDYIFFYFIGCIECNPYPFNSVTNFFKDMTINYFTGEIY